jgi:hypothetical protein
METSRQSVATEIKDHGLSFVVYSGQGDISTVKNNSGLLSIVYRSLASSIGVEPGTVKWSEIVFTRDENYVPPRDKEAVVRWSVPLSKTGVLESIGREQLFSTIPHEQVHAIQSPFGEIPRWFSEGMAEWAGLKATKLVAPDLYVKRKEQLGAAMKSATTPLALKSWGGVKPKPEAILRQLTPEQKRRMASDPGYFPPGPFTFGPDDFISDESNTLARYAASLQVFEGVEQASSIEGMRAWFQSVRSLPSPKKTSDIVRLAKETTGVDISGVID